MGFTHKKNERVSREAEVLFGHKINRGKHTKAVLQQLALEGKHDLVAMLEKEVTKVRPSALVNHCEWQMSERGMDIESVRSNIYQAWKEYEEKQEDIVEVFSQRGLLLSEGDKAIMAVSCDGVHLPVLRTINIHKRNAGEKTIRKKELDKAMPVDGHKFSAYKEEQGAFYANHFKEKIQKENGELLIIKSEQFEETLSSDHHFHSYLKKQCDHTDMTTYKLVNGISAVVVKGKGTIFVNDHSLIVTGEKTIIESVDLINNIVAYKKWKNIKLESSKNKYKQYYMDVLPIMQPQCSISSKAKEAANNIIEYELIVNEQQRLRQRQMLLLEEYFENIKNSDLAQKWEIKRLNNGYLQIKSACGVLTDKGNMISIKPTDGNIKKCVEGALILAKLKNWKVVKVKGNYDFKVVAYKQAILAGIKVQIESDGDARLMSDVSAAIKLAKESKSNSPSLFNGPR